MRTFAEKEGKEPFDWYTFLEKPFDFHTEEELDYAESLSADWVTCACGNQCESIPRQGDGRPVDARLRELGKEFSSVIFDMNEFFHYEDKPMFEERRNHALSILAQIESISEKLIMKEKSKLENQRKL